MIQRSYRNLLINLSRGFCKQIKKQNPSKGKSKTLFTKKQKNQVKTDGEQKAQGLRNSNNEQEKLGGNQKVFSQQKKKIFGNKKRQQQEKPNKQTQKVKPLKQKQFKWQQIQIDQSRLNDQLQKSKSYQNFLYLYQKHTLQQQLTQDIHSSTQQQKYTNIRTNILYYLKKNPESAVQFFKKNVLTAGLDSEKVRAISMQVNQAIIKRYIREERLKELIQFVGLLGQNKINGLSSGNGKIGILGDIQVLSEMEQSPLKYQAIENILRIYKIQDKNSQIKTKTQQSIQKTLQNFFNNKGYQNNQTKQKFQTLLQTIIKQNLLPQKFLKSNLFAKVLQNIYFTQGSSYDSLFQFVTAVKTSVTGEDYLLELFFRRFYNILQEKTLESTDCESTVFKVNAQLINKYQQFLTAQNLQATLAIIAICLNNNYLSIPEHFLKQHQKYFNRFMNRGVLTTIKQQYGLLKLSSYIRANDNSKQRQILQKQLQERKKPLFRLKRCILGKNYDEAMRIYQEEYFKKVCLEHQEKIIREVLRLYFKQLKDQVFKVQKTYLNSNIKNFTKSLSSQYLWESWKKSEDLGYLLQDYYIKEQDQKTTQAKLQKRFSFWQKYFQTKRARQINKYQKLGQLPNLKQPQQSPTFQNQFNLTQYLSPPNYQTYRSLAQANDRQQTEFAQFVHRAQLAIYQKKSNEKLAAENFNAFRSGMCEENLRVLELFGLRDYDLGEHDLGEFGNRLQNFKKFRGVVRLQDIYHRVYEQEYIKQLKLPEQQPQKQLYDQLQQGQESSSNVQASSQIKTQTSELQPPAQPQPQPQPQPQQQQQQAQAAQNKVQQAQTNQNQATDQQTQPTQPQPQHPTPQTQSAPQSTHISTTDPKTQALTPGFKGKPSLTTQLVDILRVRRRDLFERATINVVLKPEGIVEELVQWGVLHREPMAVYMGEKIAMMTKQVIRHQLAIRVSDLLSHERQISQDLFKDCKVCLTYIGPINREFIYDINKKYQHVNQKPSIRIQYQRFNPNLRQRLFQLTCYNPYRKRMNNQPRQILKNASKELF